MVCLDRDATNKSIDIKNKLESKVNTYVWMLDLDLKYYEDVDMKKWSDKICKMISL